jgi:hypothetical protein
MTDTVIRFVESKPTEESDNPIFAWHEEWEQEEQRKREVFERHYREIYKDFLLRESAEYSECSDGEKEEMLDKLATGIEELAEHREIALLNAWRRYTERYERQRENNWLVKYAE